MAAQVAQAAPPVVCRGHTRAVNDVHFSPDSAVVASAGWDSTVRLFDRATGATLTVFSEQNSFVYCVRFAWTDGDRIASGGGDKRAIIWSRTTGTTLLRLEGHSDVIMGLAWSRDDRHLATASQDRTLRVWDTGIGTCLHELTGHLGSVRSVAFSMDGRLLASGSEDKSVRMWRVDTGEELAVMREHSNYVWFVTFTDNDTLIVSAGMDNTARVWDVGQKRQLRRFPLAHAGRLSQAAVSSDGSCLVSIDFTSLAAFGMTDEHSVRIADIASGKEIAVIADTLSQLYSVAFSPDGNWIAVGTHDSTVAIWPTPDTAKLEMAWKAEHS